LGPTRSDPVHIITLRDSRPTDTFRLRPITASSGDLTDLIGQADLAALERPHAKVARLIAGADAQTNSNVRVVAVAARPAAQDERQ
jgi:hypothetical protein